ncbi:MAG: phage portal protein [Opitutaceae bacterium]|nr:phage portal protein [Opitutaceae bacterium]
MNALDRVVAYFSPVAALKRHQARAVLNHYEAGEPSRLRKFHRERGTQNEHVQRSAAAIRAQARFLARNHDIARGALRVLVNNICGPKGIGVEPQPRNADGTIHKEYARALLEAWRDWCRTPEVTHQYSFAKLQRAMVRAWMRDGEAFSQTLTGPVPYLNHGTRVPFSLEAFEADMVPMDLNDERRRIVQGVERNAWGKPTALHVLKTNAGRIGAPIASDTKRIEWERVLHVANWDHLGQVRGVSEFASVITRLEDIKDYEESERVAAKIAAMLTAFVKKGTPDLYDPASATDPREISLKPGAIIDDLAIGEEIGLVDSKRPNPNLLPFRQGQLRAVAAGLGGSYSSISRDYGGTYSSQRQELVEQWIHYAVLADDFVGQYVQPVWETFVTVADLSGVVPMPRGLKPGTADDAIYIAQAMPWIDPLKEAMGSAALVRGGFASEIEMIRRRGANPHDVLEQIAAFRAEAAELGLAFTTDGLFSADLDDDE